MANNISGNGNLTQAGLGTLVLTGTNTYTGGTYIDGGTLQLAGGPNRLPAGTEVTTAERTARLEREQPGHRLAELREQRQRRRVE